MDFLGGIDSQTMQMHVWDDKTWGKNKFSFWIYPPPQ